jgi:hypothetical protein
VATWHVNPITGQSFLVPAVWGFPPQASPNAQGNYVSNPRQAGPAGAPGPSCGPAGPPGPSLPVIGATYEYGLTPGSRGVLKSYHHDSVTGILSVNFDQVEGGLSPKWAWQSLEEFHAYMRIVIQLSPPPPSNSKYPHVCKRCGSACYEGFFQVDCSNTGCPTKS